MAILPTPLQKISHPLLVEKAITLYIKRDDLIHPEMMGNKWRKLKYNLAAIRDQGLNSLVTMGGAYSNHIAATAAAAQENNLKATGIIRGEELNKESNPTLKFASEKGMNFEFVDRTAFRKLREHPHRLIDKYPGHYFLPEGGTNDLAIKGCEEIVKEIDIEFDVFVTPIGTGGTFAGVLKAAENRKKIIGVSSLKGDFIHNEIQDLLKKHQIDYTNYQIIDNYHFGGYGKTNPVLIDFINEFKEKLNISLDPIYTGKAFFAVWDMIKSNKFEKNLKIVILHTGGLQGIEGFNRKNENIIQ
ncbi:1-aminocyclopropane-1-carboxylate deaminase/D-cysteine desulfhydrase [Ekhidna sp. To15]|uniref:1-aminocyclopropane-1-carboxylate deaminase/D-cysteine desulfhydrase n=1 Tax=Ekhidna sp. To15 TaxID=3395267 RepID=UPI003F51D6FA